MLVIKKFAKINAQLGAIRHGIKDGPIPIALKLYIA